MKGKIAPIMKFRQDNNINSTLFGNINFALPYGNNKITLGKDGICVLSLSDESECYASYDVGGER